MKGLLIHVRQPLETVEFYENASLYAKESTLKVQGEIMAGLSLKAALLRDPTLETTNGHIYLHGDAGGERFISEGEKREGCKLRVAVSQAPMLACILCYTQDQAVCTKTNPGENVVQHILRTAT